MKKAALSLILIALCLITFTQVPEFFNYQVVVRDGLNPLTNKDVSFQMSILKGSTSGDAIYTEYHSANTGELGVVNLVIGNGTGKVGDIAAIDWGSDSYFLKVSIDKTGGTTYVEMGTTQILSVPYAIYAKTSSDAVKIAGNQTIEGNKTFTGTTTIPAPVNSTDAATKAYVDSKIPIHFIGESFGGGIVFWIDETGQHGLICSMIDLGTSQIWSDISTIEIGITAQSDWDGLSNSNAIVGQPGHTTSAAKLCIDYSNEDYGTGVYSDWYLPAIDQLILLYNTKYQVNKTLTSDGNSSTTVLFKNSYWTSTERNDISAYISDYSLDIFDTDKTEEGYVRAIRSF